MIIIPPKPEVDFTDELLTSKGGRQLLSLLALSNINTIKASKSIKTCSAFKGMVYQINSVLKFLPTFLNFIQGSW